MPIFYALLLMCVVSLIGFAFLLSRQLLQEQQSQQLLTDIKQLRSELTALNSASVGVGQRLLATERNLSRTIEKQQYLEHSQSASFPLLTQAVSAQQLVDEFGFSEVEAHLMTRVNDAVNNPLTNPESPPQNDAVKQAAEAEAT